MANPKDLEILIQGVEPWNRWRAEQPDIVPDLNGANLDKVNLAQANLRETMLRETILTQADLSEADLLGADLFKADLSDAKAAAANLSEANLTDADLTGAYLRGANFTRGKLSRANFHGADLSWANFNEADLQDANLSHSKLKKADLIGARLTGAKLFACYLSGAYLLGADLANADLHSANLREANLTGASLQGVDLRETLLLGTNLSSASLVGANLSGANLYQANLMGANLQEATLVGVNLEKANLNNCHIYGISAWDLKLDLNTEQTNLIITEAGEPKITVDNLQIAQFIYLLLKNKNVRHIIDTITSKVVLILGRFTDERKGVLDAIRDNLRQMDFTPVLFDFEKPASKDVTGTVETLARMAKFIIADLTDPSSIPHELATLVPHLRTTPVCLLKQEGSKGYRMIEDYECSYPWVIKTHEYIDGAALIAELKQVIEPANTMAERFRVNRHLNP